MTFGFPVLLKKAAAAELASLKQSSLKSPAFSALLGMATGGLKVKNIEVCHSVLGKESSGVKKSLDSDFRRNDGNGDLARVGRNNCKALRRMNHTGFGVLR